MMKKAFKIFVVKDVEVKRIRSVDISTAGFIGVTEKGPSMPELITSWLHYQKIFGGFFSTDKYLPYSVEGFFKN